MVQRLKSSGRDGLHTGTDAGFQWRSRQKKSGRQMLGMKHGFDSFISTLDPAEARVGELATKSRKIPKLRPKEKKKKKKHNEEQRSHDGGMLSKGLICI